MNFEQWCSEMQIQGKWQDKLRTALENEGCNVETSDEEVFVPVWDGIVRQKPALSKYAMANRIGISRQAIGQWPNFDISDKDVIASYLRDRAKTTRARGLSALDLAARLGETARHYLITETDSTLIPAEVVSKKVGRPRQYVVKWGLALYPVAIINKCRELEAYNKERGQFYIDCAANMITIAREIEEGKW